MINPKPPGNPPEINFTFENIQELYNNWEVNVEKAKERKSSQ
jgi:hypothetical protein